LVINFTSISDIPIGYTSGKHLHALFLTLVNSVDQQLAEYFHKSEQNKSFTVSPLQVINSQKSSNFLQWQQEKNIKKGSNCWWRITLLDDTLFSQLTKLWINLNPQKPYHLGSGELLITSVLASPNSHPWAGAYNYQQIYEEASNVERNFNFKIVTPTAFRQGKYDISLPTANLIFSSLLKRWQKYSNIPLNLSSFDYLFPAYFNIKTEIVIDSKTKFIGCIGNINYKLLGDIDLQIIKNINVLADYSFYCGLGRKTTMGFGIIKRYVQQNN
uniref:CRISPR-associated endoribonuclease Cas6 n=1 Tax=Geminocystis sp. TaxID=2664100 RepID=UPI003593C8F3